MNIHVRRITVGVAAGVLAVACTLVSPGAPPLPAAHGQTSLGSSSNGGNLPAPDRTRQEQRLRAAMAHYYEVHGFWATSNARAEADRLLRQARAGELTYDQYGEYYRETPFLVHYSLRVLHDEVDSAIRYLENHERGDYDVYPGSYGVAVGSDSRYYYVAVGLTLD